MTKWYGGIEAGGTKFVCTVAADPKNILAEERFPTTIPQETLPKAIRFFAEQSKKVSLHSIGVAAFGPVDLNPKSPTYGHITQTPKPNWSHTDFVGTIQQALNIPVGFDTDVNGAALGEHRWGAAQGLDTFIYLTIGTGIGGGGMVGGQLMHGLVHPEMGHIRLPHNLEKDPFPGNCPFHGDCFEGLACGPAMQARWQQPAETLPHDHPAWELEAEYIAQALSNFIFTLSPQRIILGGGVMAQPHLFGMVQQHVLTLVNGYVQAPEILEQIETYIMPPALDNMAGMMGAIALAQSV